MVKTEKLDGGETTTTKGKSLRKRNRPGKIANIEDISNGSDSTVEAGGMRLLMDYTSLLIDRVVEILTQVIAWCDDNQGTMSPEILWKSLENGLIGKILPSLITGLILFSGSHEFSKVFLQPFTTLLGLLDRLLNFSGEVIAMEQAGTQSLEESFDGQQNNHNTRLRNVNHRGSGGASTPTRSNGSNDNSSVSGSLNSSLKETAQLFNFNSQKPYTWIMNLEKNIAVLSSRMAATLVTGEGIIASKTVSLKSNNPLRMLCRNGHEDTIIESVNLFTQNKIGNEKADGGLTTSYSHFGGHISRANEEIALQSISLSSATSDASDASKQDEDELSVIIKGWAKHLGLSLGERREFIQLFFTNASADNSHALNIQIESIDTIIKWLKSNYILRNSQYKMSLLQYRNNKDMCQVLDQLERAVAAVVIKHYNLIPDIMAYARMLILQDSQKEDSTQSEIDINSLHVPLRLGIIWENASNMRQWVLRHRNTRPSDKTVDINTYIMNIAHQSIHKCKALLFYKPFTLAASSFMRNHGGISILPLPPLVTSPSDPSTASYNNNASWVQRSTSYKYDGLSFLRRYPRSKWRSIRSLLFVTVRWKLLTKYGEKMLKAKADGRKKHSNKSHQSKKNGSEVAESSLFVFEALVQSYGSQSNQDILEVGLLDSELALCRASGLYSYECLLKSVQLPSLKKAFFAP